MSKIKAGTTSTTAYQVEADTTGTLVLQTGASPTTAVTIGSDQSTTLAGTLNLASQNMTPYTGFKNRIINGAMMIDQRNAGATVTPALAPTFTLDRWKCTQSQSSKFSVQQNAGSVTPPAGFTNYAGITSLSAYSVLTGDTFNFRQLVEGFNAADLAWGTANAATVTLSFWVRSSLTGTFSGALNNAAFDRSYPFTYTISAANTWEQKSITIAGDTTGTWNKTNDVGIGINFSLGQGSTYSAAAGAWASGTYLGATGAVSVVGTNGATFYITGVQLEKGSTATSFDYRPYGTELALCQRYFYKAYNPSGASTSYLGLVGALSTTRCIGTPLVLPVSMRLTPAGGLSITSSSLNLYTLNSGSSYAITSLSPYSGDGASSTSLDMYVASGLTAGTAYIFTMASPGFVAYSAEL